MHVLPFLSVRHRQHWLFELRLEGAAPPTRPQVQTLQATADATSARLHIQISRHHAAIASLVKPFQHPIPMSARPESESMALKPAPLQWPTAVAVHPTRPACLETHHAPPIGVAVCRDRDWPTKIVRNPVERLVSSLATRAEP